MCIEDSDLKNLGNLIKSRRKELGLTQSEVAEKVGLTMQHYSRIERAEYIPSLQTFITLSKFLDIDLSFLNISAEKEVSSTMFEIVSLLGKFSNTKQKAVLSFLKSMA